MGYEQITGRTPDISEFLDFDFYDLVWYWPHDHPNVGQTGGELARWVGVSSEQDWIRPLLLVDPSLWHSCGGHYSATHHS